MCSATLTTFFHSDALTLEHLEAAFYKEGLAMYNSQQFLDADYPDWVRCTSWGLLYQRPDI